MASILGKERIHVESLNEAIEYNDVAAANPNNTAIEILLTLSDSNDNVYSEIAEGLLIFRQSILNFI